jgi:hypothetical protein
MAAQRLSNGPAGTTILTGLSIKDGEDGIFIVDASDDLRRVVIISPWHREEGTPESALAFATRLRRAHGNVFEEFCVAIERAARMCACESKTPRPS